VYKVNAFTLLQTVEEGSNSDLLCWCLSVIFLVISGRYVMDVSLLTPGPVMDWVSITHVFNFTRHRVVFGVDKEESAYSHEEQFPYLLD
jgi:hypothetical protein